MDFRNRLKTKPEVHTGALNDILQVFRKYGLNLTKIESRPTKKKAWEYVFFMDFSGHSTDSVVQKALQELRKFCIYVKVLGSYPRSEPLS